MNTSIRVLSCLHRSLPGGAHWRAAWIADRLEAHQVHTTIAFPEDDVMAYAAALKASGRDFVRLVTPPIQRSFAANMRFGATLATTTMRFRRVLRRLNIDLVHANGATLLQPVLAASSLGIPVVWHFNDMQTPAWYMRANLPLMRRRLVRPVVATEAILDHYDIRRQLGDHWSYLPAPLPDRSGTRSRPIADAFPAMSPGSRVIGFVGNLLRIKGAHDFLAATLPILERDTDIHAVVVGPGFPGRDHEAYERELHARVADSSARQRVHFVGFQANVYAWMERFDVLAFPSYSEACPIVVLEAMEIGLPIAATAVGEVPKMLADSSLPLLQPGDVGSLEHALRRLIYLDRDQRSDLARRLQSKVRASYSLDRVARLHVELYQDLTRRRLSDR